MHQLRHVANGERGHALPATAGIIGVAGAILLAIGITGDNDALTWIGAIGVGAGPLAAAIVNHMTVEYGIFARLEEQEKQQ